jgi:hypothetical protein
MAWSAAMAKSRPPESGKDAPRRGHARAAGDLVADIAGSSFRKFGFMQSSVVSRWAEIVGERYARVSSPESIRFPSGRKSGGTLTLSVEGAHAPLIQHLGPMVIERVNRFFGYEAIDKIAFRQGRAPAKPSVPARPDSAPVSREMGEGLRQIADPELRAVLESMAGKLAATSGAPVVPESVKTIPFLVRSDRPK